LSGGRAACAIDANWSSSEREKLAKTERYRHIRSVSLRELMSHFDV